MSDDRYEQLEQGLRDVGVPLEVVFLERALQTAVRRADNSRLEYVRACALAGRERPRYWAKLLRRNQADKRRRRLSHRVEVAAEALRGAEGAVRDIAALRQRALEKV